jgi:hypothetical protein
MNLFSIYRRFLINKVIGLLNVTGQLPIREVARGIVLDNEY